MASGEELAARQTLVPATPAEWLTEQFYAWEKRGRGWQVCPYPVELEPAFDPFLFHSMPALPAIDDARKPTALSRFVERLKSRFTPQAAVLQTEPHPVPEYEPLEPVPFDLPDRLAELQIAIPTDLKVSKTAAEQFLLSLSYCEYPVAFEMVGSADTIFVQFTCAESDRQQVSAALTACFPECALEEHRDRLRSLWQLGPAVESTLVEFGLSHEFMRPLRTIDRFETDPLAPFVAALGALRNAEIGVLQVLLQRARYPWADSCLRAVVDWEGRSFFADAPEMVALAKEKVSRPLFACVLRAAAKSSVYGRPLEVIRHIASGLNQFSDPLSNELIPLANEGYDDEDHVADLILRQSRRSGMLLNSEELLSLVHLPSASVQSPKLRRDVRKTKAAAAIAQGHEFVIGENFHQGTTTRVTLNHAQRLQHMYVIGASGTGKSTLLLNLMIQDLERGSGFAVLDPHGDLIDEILGHLPESRFDDVILFDPSDEEYPIAFNILRAHSELERNLVASDLVAVFRRLSTSWGDQMTSVLGNAVLAFLESSRGGSLADLRRFLVEPEFRREFLATVADATVRYFWEKEFPLLAGKPQAPLLTRLDAFLRPKLVRCMVSQREDRLDFAEIVNGGKVFLAKLAQGMIGEENAWLLGSFLVSKFHQVAMSRQQLDRASRRPFYLYIDEFHNFVTPSMASILSGARKYGLGLVLAHQDLRQLWERDSVVANAVISNSYTRICFRLGDFDARKLEDGLSFFGARDLQNLGRGEAICRVERADCDFNVRTLPAPEIADDVASSRRERVLALSRERYGFAPEAASADLIAETASPAETNTHIQRRSVSAPREVTTARASAELPREIERESNLPGRGGRQHKYLQDMIKRWAEARGYTVTLEKPVLDGLGSIDVVLEKQGCAPVACEISVTTSPEHELGNAEKCFAAGFEHVLLVAPDQDTLGRVKACAASVLGRNQMNKIRFVLPEEMFVAVSGLEARSPAPKTVPAEGQELLTAKEVEELLRIDVKTIYGYVQKGRIPYVRIQSNLRFLRSEIMAWVEAHRSGAKTGSKK